MHTQKLLLCATGLLLACSLLAQATPSSPQGHKTLEFTEVTATYTFHDGTTATWKANPDGSYTLSLAQDPGLKNSSNDDGATSLLTAGIQGIDNYVDVVLITGSGVEVKDMTKPKPVWTQLQAMGQKTRFSATGTDASGKVNEDNIGFIRFEGTSCTLWVSSGKVRKGHTKWHGLPSLFTSHDNTPPGMPPGSEN